MRHVKMLAVLVASSACGIGLGTAGSSLLRTAEARQAPPDGLNFRHRIDDYRVESLRPGLLRVSGVLRIGAPEDRPEPASLRITIHSIGGIRDGVVPVKVIDREFDRFVVGAGESDLRFPFDLSYELPPGDYSATVAQVHPQGRVLGPDRKPTGEPLVVCHARRPATVD